MVAYEHHLVSEHWTFHPSGVDVISFQQTQVVCEDHAHRRGTSHVYRYRDVPSLTAAKYKVLRL